MPIDPELLEILACPKCKKPLTEQKKGDDEFLVCAECNVGYPIRDDIPVLLIEEGQPWG